MSDFQNKTSIQEDNGAAGYLFVFFTGEHEDGEQIYFAVSRDGLHWEELNGGKPVLRSGIGQKGVREPFPVRDPKTGKCYLIATDLRIGAENDWDKAQYAGSRDLMVWESEDLVNWKGPRSCTVGVPEAGCVWAPECIYDEEKEAFFVFWASMVRLPGESRAKQRIYGAYTRDFVQFGESFIYLDTPEDVIDMNIVYKGGFYYRFVKNEVTKKVWMDRMTGLQEKKAERLDVPLLEELGGVEGPECYPLPDGTWCLILDQFGTGKGYLPLLCSNLEKADFQVAQAGSYDLGTLKKRHGGVLAIRQDEMDRLRERFGASR